jgi:selenocysteine-specific elongation factor
MKHLIIGTAGHIDHGKTSLIKMLTGIDCDTHKEEKQRGITINLGFSYINLPGGESLGIIDVPGHKDFINTMIGGACGIDMVLLVIAADSGIMPQTHEHMNIINALGISNGVVALTKSDLVDDELLEIAAYEINEFLSGTSLKNAAVVPVSSLTGNGKEELINAIAAAFSVIPEREPGKVFRMYVDRIFTAKGFGNVVTGSVMSGKISLDQDVYLLPGDKLKLRVRSLERHGRPVETVTAGDRAAINLTGLRREAFERGMIICDKPVEPTQMIDAAISMFDTHFSLSVWSNVVFISGTLECQARMHLLNADILKGKEEAIVQLHLSKPAILFSNDRFIIRNSSEDFTLGGGTVLEASPLHHRKRTAKLIDELTRLHHNMLSGNSLREMIHQALKKQLRPFGADELAEKLNSSQDEVSAEAGKGEGFITYTSENQHVFINSDYDAAFKEKIVKSIAEHHKKNPLAASGLENVEISGKLGLTKIPAGKAYLESVLNELHAGGRLEKSGQTWIVKGHKPDFDRQSLAEIAWLEQLILDFEENKPSMAEIEEKAAARNISRHKLKAYLSYLAGEGKIRYFKSEIIHTSIVEKYRRHLLEQLAKQPAGIGIMAFKETLGTKKMRAFIIQMLEADGLISVEAGDSVETKLHISPKGLKIISGEANLG